MTWNPRFVLFARAHGQTPERMRREPSCNLAFIRWIHGQWNDYDAAHGRTKAQGLSDAEQASFDAWLTARVDSIASSERRTA